MNSIAEAEAVLGCSIILDKSENNALRQMKEGKGNIRFIRALLWAGLLPEDPDLTLSQAGELITFQHMAEINDGVSKALRLFFRSQGIELPETAASGAAPLEQKVIDTTATPVDGSPSGASPATTSV